jgi:acetyl-CoA carboxylase carboxyl transferase subunit beta
MPAESGGAGYGMNWLSDYVRPKINSLFSRREMPENLWRKCDNCGQMIFHRELRDALRLPGLRPPHDDLARARVSMRCSTAATGSRRRRPRSRPTRSSSATRSAIRTGIRDARAKTGEDEAMLVARGEIGGLHTVAACQNFEFMAGSMGLAVGEALLTAAETATSVNAPLVVFCAAGGARMQEGILSLMQMPRTTIAAQMMREARLPFVTVLTDPTTGGVTASYAMLGDIQIAEPGALICFAGPRVIEQTIRETLPEGFQRAEYLLDHGMLDRWCIAGSCATISPRSCGSCCASRRASMATCPRRSLTAHDRRDRPKPRSGDDRRAPRPATRSSRGCSRCTRR